MDQVRVDEIVRRYLAGETVREIAAALDESFGKIRSAIGKAGVHRERVSAGPKRSLTPEQEVDIGRRYAQGEGINDIARDTGIPRTSVKRTLTRRGVETRADSWAKPVPQETRKKLIEMHTEGGATLNEVAECFGVSKGGAFQIVKREGMGKGRGAGRRRGYTLNEKVFDTITPVSARWIGFLFADGCLPRDTGSQALSMNIGNKDRGHVEKFRRFLGSNHAITNTFNKARDIAGNGHITPAGPAVFYKVRSERLTNALLGHGMTKLGPDRAPTAVLADMPAFWAGCVDGDGSIGNSYNDGILYPHLMLCGHMPIMEAFQRFLSRRRIVNASITSTESGIWRIQTSGSTAAQIIELLYHEESAAAGLDRKLLRSHQILRGEKVEGYEGPVDAIKELQTSDEPANADVSEPDDLGFQIEPTTIEVVADLCQRYHGYGSAGQIATYAFAVIENGEPVAAFAWQPASLGSANAACPEAPEGVLTLSRMVAVPKTERRLRHLSKPLRHQMLHLIDRTRWPVLVTYSDEGQGHTGHVYKCSGWMPTARTVNPVHVNSEGQRVSIPTSDKREDRDAKREGTTTMQRWEHRVCRSGEGAEHMAKHGWRRVEIPGRTLRSGNQASTWVRESSH